jgi:hypothetical protein
MQTVTCIACYLDLDINTIALLIILHDRKVSPANPEIAYLP